MTKELLIKFLNNNCTDAELNEVLQWAQDEALTEKDKNLVLEDWNNYQEEDGMGSEVKFSALFDKIQEEIDSRENINEEKKTYSISVFSTWITRAAAILLIPVLGFLFYILSENNPMKSQTELAVVDSLEIISPIGSRTVVQLSDGSAVHLNYGSKIIYPQHFSGDTREIQLVGEGYFEVSHNPEKPFIVKTGNLNVKVLGTSFNVHAYPDHDLIETTLVEGKVVLEQSEKDGSIKAIGAMEPGQHVKYNVNSGVVSSIKGDVEKYIAWTDGKLVFEDTPIADVAEKLSRMFNVDIEVDKEIEEFVYTVTLIDEPLFQILDLMTIATPVKYKAFPRQKLADGTYSKQKIFIEKN